jgi:uncharacterized membrane protein
MENPPPGQPPGPPPGWSPPPDQQPPPPQYQPPQPPPPPQQPPPPQAPGPPQYQPPSQQPPPYQPPQYQAPSGGGSGVDKKTGSILSYVLGWVTGIIFLFVGKDDPDVKFHAAQSIVFFGGMTVVFWVVRIIGTIVGSLAFDALLLLVQIALGVFTFVVWIMCLVRANQGGGARFPIPVVGDFVTPYAEQLSNAVN